MFESGSKTCCLISGASRGFGRSVAVALAGQFSDSGTKGHFILISRSGDDLEETRNTIIQVCATAEVHIVIANLGEMNTLDQTLKTAFSKVDPSKVTHALLVNNAGSIGDVSKDTKDVSQDVSSLQDYFNLNLTSPMFLTSKFLQQFKEASCTVVNVSSLMAVQAFPYFSLYCTGKAARDMMCQVLAKEEPNVRVLNYAPGPLLTNMYETIRTTCGNHEVVEMFNTSKEENKVLSPDESARKLLIILKENTFTSGSHVDYFD
ncbi:sepiapterin reductase-like [Orbicella faveolata]|uniref:sepiapterin reductase-like n=1 Tax=Orbicella faveolata TaxID=48498 RepID=UPI0009E1C919|nr:sepiapterin reductase-like [Orbicella faveolata]